MNISFESPYYNIIKYEKVKTIEVCNKFINWLSGEFDLYQKDESDGLKVFYPNGWFSVEIIDNHPQHIEILIFIKSKTLEIGLKKATQIEAIFSHLNLNTN
ncbi:hypothetical protein IWX83_002122 [Flavobacterium sp. CG_9.1]|uniref:hypothetical protein n=1 Tax=Flavobacterium sp. CG_9.1 TaxID=2787728 RepID=UPI0018C97692|nr:hypothetical protein [Flavobacterium sp. CG_9.1]MBG6062324.1 hypothetical protein [Flavobacterium sp. CG_9.1]